MPKRKTAAQTSDARNTIPVGFDADTNRKLNRIAESGIPKTMQIARIVRAFLNAPDSIQHILLGDAAGDMKEEYLKRAVDYIKDRLNGNQVFLADPFSEPGSGESGQPSQEPPVPPASAKQEEGETPKRAEPAKPPSANRRAARPQDDPRPQGAGREK